VYLSAVAHRYTDGCSYDRKARLNDDSAARVSLS